MTDLSVVKYLRDIRIYCMRFDGDDDGDDDDDDMMMMMMVLSDWLTRRVSLLLYHYCFVSLGKSYLIGKSKKVIFF